MIPSSQMSTSESIEDQRFAELLKPIKDLTQNWEVTSLSTPDQPSKLFSVAFSIIIIS